MRKTLIIGLTVATVFVIAQANVQRSDQPREARAIGALRGVATAQLSYAATNGGYARSLRTLAIPCSGENRGFLSPDLETDPTISSGYEIRLQPARPAPDGRLDCHGQPTADAYYATAVPVRSTERALRAFAVDQNAVIWYDETGIAPTPPFHETTTVKRLR
jgi:hypothetical protein